MLTHLILRWMKVVQIYSVYSLIICYLETIPVIKKKDKNDLEIFWDKSHIQARQNVWISYMYICETCTEEFAVPRLSVKHLLNFMARKLQSFVLKILSCMFWQTDLHCAGSLGPFRCQEVVNWTILRMCLRY